MQRTFLKRVDTFFVCVLVVACEQAGGFIIVARVKTGYSPIQSVGRCPFESAISLAAAPIYLPLSLLVRVIE